MYCYCHLKEIDNDTEKMCDRLDHLKTRSNHLSKILAIFIAGSNYLSKTLLIYFVSLFKPETNT